MFFMTSNLLGLEKVVEVKWKLDTDQGEGYKDVNQGDFFLESSKLSELENSLKTFFAGKLRSNAEIFEFVLKEGFRATHAVKILKEWQARDLISVKEVSTGKPVRKSTFRLNYDGYKSPQKHLLVELT